jgi:probable HAF family extracellular repeat protein
MRRLLFFAALAVAATVGLEPKPVAATAAQYSIQDLGILNANSYAKAINRYGEVAGYAAVGSDINAFLYRPASGSETLGVLPGATGSQAFSLNDAAEVVGESGGQAFVYDAAGMRGLGTLGGSTSAATGVNLRGDIVGYAETSGRLTRAFRKLAGGAMEELGTLGGSNSWAMAVNATGQVTGSAETGLGLSAMRAFRYTDGIGMEDLGTLGGDYSYGNAINASGQVAGRSYISSNGSYRAFRYTDGIGLEDLGTLGISLSAAEAINDAGDVVGWACTASGTQSAFLALSGAPMQDLNEMIDPAAGWVLDAATGITNDGRIVGYGLLNGKRRAFLLTPLQPPPGGGGQDPPVGPPPAFTAIPSILWPPNQAMIAVTLHPESGGDATACSIAAVTSSEPDTTPARDDLQGDVQMIDRLTVALRAERFANGPGRVYSITIDCGTAGTAQSTVTVPHDQGKQIQAVKKGR